MPKLMSKAKALQVYQGLRAAHPDAHCELVHRSVYELLCATVMSAQSTDVGVNKATPRLFARFPDAHAMAVARQEEVEELINTIGMYRQKSKNLIALSKLLVERHGGEVPRTLDELVELPGVGRKTANVVLGVTWNNQEGIVVDTHVMRIAQRLGWSKNSDAVTVEQDLVKIFPRDEWNMVGHTIVFHGRRVCEARKPKCADCTVAAGCPSAGKAELVGRK